MLAFSQLCESIAATAKKLEKIRLVAQFLSESKIEEASLAALYLCGTPFPRREERILAIGFSLLLHAVASIAQVGEQEIAPALRHHGDLGGGAEEILSKRPPVHTSAVPVSLPEMATIFDALSRQRRSASKQRLLEQTLQRMSPLEAKYFIKIATSELRIGLKESLVEEGIAAAFEQPLAAVQRANMLTGDISEVMRLASARELSATRLQLFRPVSVMLASPAESTAELIANFPNGALIEEKFDGIRAQAHKSDADVVLYSRTLDRITEFPELIEPLRKVPGEFILDGEIIGFRDGRALPFTELQQRLGRKQIDLFTATRIPVAFVAFDLLLLNGDELLEVPLAERRIKLTSLLGASETPQLQFTRSNLCTTAEEVEVAFAAAIAAANEGLLAKAPESPYVPGRRGKYWQKLKRPLATLDVVVTAVEFGHGKRRGLLSDYTFAVRDPSGKLVNIGKAYSGLTDVEIKEMTEYFHAHTLKDSGFRRTVEPNMVIEVAFNNVQRSKRHDSGYALRFPRIVRLRPDKPVSEIDTLGRVAEIFASQGHGPSGS